MFFLFFLRVNVFTKKKCKIIKNLQRLTPQNRNHTLHSFYSFLCIFFYFVLAALLPRRSRNKIMQTVFFLHECLLHTSEPSILCILYKSHERTRFAFVSTHLSMYLSIYLSLSNEKYSSELKQEK